jgi:heavy metal translocating P-type ATPase
VSPKIETAPEDLFCCIGCRLAASMVGKKNGAVEFLEARLLLSAFLAMGVMTFSLVLYGEAVYGAEDDPGMNAIRSIGRMALTIFSLPVFLLLGLPLLHGAWLDLRRGVFRMDGLICLATLAAYGLSVHNTMAETGEVYFDTATMVLVLVMFGRRLEAHSRVRGRDAADFLAELLPDKARVRGADGTELEVEPGELAPGDIVVILPGELVPADLVIQEGKSEVVEAHVNGEHVPRSIEAQSTVHAGAINGTGALVASVIRSAEEGSLGRIRRLLDSPFGMTKIMLLADRMAVFLAAIALSLAGLGGFIATRSSGIGEGLEVALSVLLVACPCALGLATPLAYRAMRAALAKQGVLVSDPRALEAAATIDQVLLDKTGTLTEPMGKLQSANGAHPQEVAKLEALVAATNHPLAMATHSQNIRAQSIKVVPGSGVSGVINGEDCFAGSPAWMDNQGFDWQPNMDLQRNELADHGATMVAFAEFGRVSALAYLDQRLKPSAQEVVDDLKARGLEPVILSGDHQRAVKKIGDQLGIDAHGGLDPSQKLEHLKRVQAEGHRVLVLGDGLNDAPMLRAADVGVAVADGTAAARSQAGIEILEDDLSRVTLLLRGADRLRRVAYGNVVWTIVYNVVALGLAATGNLHPLLAAALMIVSSLVVCARSYGLLSFGEKRK